MPIYEYRCGACGHEIEALQKMSDGPLRKCPECGKSQLRRLVSAPSFRLKGGGWYETDFKGNGEKKRNLVETAGGDSSESSSAKADAPSDSGKDSTSKETSAKVAEAKSADSADKKPKPEKAGKAAAKKSASKPKPKPPSKKSARA
jgi:putative FmdB family regulatory protein